MRAVQGRSVEKVFTVDGFAIGIGISVPFMAPVEQHAYSTVLGGWKK